MPGQKSFDFHPPKLPIHREILRRVGGHRYAMWFGASCDFDQVEGRLIVAAMTSRVRDWIDRHYRNELEDAARALGMNEVEIIAIDQAQPNSVNVSGSTPQR